MDKSSHLYVADVKMLQFFCFIVIQHYWFLISPSIVSRGGPSYYINTLQSINVDVKSFDTKEGI